MTALTDISGVGPTLAALFKAHGFDSAEAVAAATPEQLMQVPRIGALRAPVLIAQAGDVVGSASAPKTVKPAIEQAQTQPKNVATPDQGAKPAEKAKPKKTKSKKPKASAKKTKAEKPKASKSKKPSKKAKVKSADSKKTKTVKADKKSKSDKKAKADTSKKSGKKKKK
ncbi:MAG: helix-hairpin-helix domain-containing protein [Pseudomonadota bacterium]|nr:helix-hairpin-helix domain-containing protein [Pseudomonadota bacterium]